MSTKMMGSPPPSPDQDPPGEKEQAKAELPCISRISHDRLAQNDRRVKSAPGKDFQALMLLDESG